MKVLLFPEKRAPVCLYICIYVIDCRVRNHDDGEMTKRWRHLHHRHHHHGHRAVDVTCRLLISSVQLSQLLFFSPRTVKFATRVGQKLATHFRTVIMSAWLQS